LYLPKKYLNMEKSFKIALFTIFVLAGSIMSSCQEEIVKPANSPRDATSGLTTDGGNSGGGGSSSAGNSGSGGNGGTSPRDAVTGL
jgi:hypothetical protein